MEVGNSRCEILWKQSIIKALKIADNDLHPHNNLEVNEFGEICGCAKSLYSDIIKVEVIFLLYKTDQDLTRFNAWSL